MKVTILARNFSGQDDTPLRLLADAGFEVNDQSAGELGIGAGGKKLLECIGDSDVVIAGLEGYPAALLEACPNLKLISRRGIGYDAIDVDACRKLGIGLIRTFGQVEGAVAEHIMASILWFARDLRRENEEMHRGIWHRQMSMGAKNRTVGLVGFGGIGKEVALRAHAFGMRILYNCRHPQPEWEPQYGVTYAPLNELLAESDFICACVPLTADTKGMFDSAVFARMKHGSFFINAARSPIMDVIALKDAVENGHLAGAAVDVFPYEPCADSPLIGVKNILLTPHSAPFTRENFLQMNRVAAQNVNDYLAGTIDPKCVVCPSERVAQRRKNGILLENAAWKLQRI